MLAKLAKHTDILKRSVLHKNQISRLRKYDNKLLHSVLNAVENAKRDEFSAADQQVFGQLEQYRSQLLNDSSVITYEVFDLDSTNIVKNICINATSPPKWCRLHYSLAKETGAAQYLEIGTNLGVSGSYILSAIKDKKNCKFTTMEGLPALCKIASGNFSKIAGADSFEVIQGLYDQTFPELMSREIKFDVMFIDGYHKKKPTLEYYEKLKNHSSDQAVFVFDDINWDDEMKDAWQIIKNDPKANFVIDLYKLGIVIIDKNEKVKGVKADLFYAY